MRYFVLSMVASASLAAVVSLPAWSQSPTPAPCGPVAYSAAAHPRIDMTQTTATPAAATTSTTAGARAHARDQHGRTADTMRHVPATSAPARLTAHAADLEDDTNAVNSSHSEAPTPAETPPRTSRR